MIELIGPEREKVLKLREALSSTNRWTGAAASAPRIKPDPTKVLGNAPPGQLKRSALHIAVMKDSSKAQEQVVIAVVWHRPEQWQRVRDIATDSDDLEGSYAEWLEQAEEKFAKLQRTGRRVEKVDAYRWADQDDGDD